MATKSNFTSEEWGKLLASPMVAGMAITAADPGGLWSLLKEGMAGGWALLEARQNTQANQLVKAVAEDFSTDEGRTAARAAVDARFTGAKLDGLKDKALAELKSISSILDAKAPDDQTAIPAPVGEKREGEMSKQEATALLDAQRDDEVQPEQIMKRLHGAAVAEPAQDW